MSTIETVAPNVERLSLRTPTLPPATETNTYFVERDLEFYVVEPAPSFDEERAMLLEATDRKIRGGWRLRGVILTHHHGDHIGAADAMRAAFGAPTMAHHETRARLRDHVAVDRVLDEGDTLFDGEVELVHTPGHARGHLCLRDRARRWLIAGDMVASVGTIVIDPDDGGDMRAYVAQLTRLADEGAGIVLPAHGAPIEEGEARLRFYVAHRLAREAKVLAAVAGFEARGASEDQVVERAYEDTPRAIWPIALRSARAHLGKLAAEGAVRLDGDRWFAL
ncbi:MAG: MBL fold metallo-hydrolase [Myxococcales bacterium]|nr:MBL fold metallo-hydrolase [Myxococcales bacterium]